MGVAEAEQEIVVARREMKEAEHEIVQFTELHNQVERDWSNIDHRVLGYL